MTKKARKRRGSSKAGRPRKAGERLACGRLKAAPDPNQIMLERRRELCDDVTMASCPLDAAYANGWLTVAEYRTGAAYASLRRQAVPGLPGMASGSNQETDASVMEDGVGSAKNLWATMPDSQIRQVWDSAFREVRAEGDQTELEKQAAAAMARSKIADAAMTYAERREVEAVCVYQDWPAWFAARRSGALDQPGFKLLVSGLRKIAQAWRPDAANDDRRPNAIAPVPYRPSLYGRPVERMTYVNENGAVLLEVERVGTRRAG